MSTLPIAFDPLAVVVDWLDACRSGKLDQLLDLYHERATLVCNCEYVTLTGRESIAAYWAPKLQSKHVLTFHLDDLVPTDYGARVDYRGFQGKPVRAYFHFSHSGKILTMSCRRRDVAHTIG
jgi:hypothetical protein